jgi:hypothetical protein
VTQDEVATRKRLLDQQLEAGIDLLRRAHRAQVRALELVWMANPAAELTPLPVAAQAVESPQALTPASPETPRPRRRGAWELHEEVLTALGQVGAEFDRNDVCRALGYEPDRSSLQRTLVQLQGEGVIALTATGTGRTPARWAKLAPADAAGAQGS